MATTQAQCQILRTADFFEPDGMPLCVFRMPFVHIDRKRHSHEFFEIMMVIGGFATHHIAGVTQTVSMGDVFFIRPGEAHAYEVGDGGVQLLNILFLPEMIEADLRDLPASRGFQSLVGANSVNPHNYSHLRLSAKDLAQVNSIAEHIEIEQEDLAPGFELVCGSKFEELLVILSRRLIHARARTDKHVNQLGEVLAYIEDHLDETIDFQTIAEVAKMSPTSVRRAFQEAFGCSPIAYMRHVRIKKAMLYLNDLSKSITDVAFEVGFSDSGHFARVFKNETGQTPSEFRKRLK
jgi:AraC family L-rhamnose operon transcriptional activator RhaR/AraC family L-rhamnose operon regulatory protein RhaS